MRTGERIRSWLSGRWSALSGWSADEDRREWLVVLVLLLALFVSFLSRAGFPYDRGDWIRWAQQIQTGGVAHVYDAGANYHPLWLYVLAVYANLCPDAQAVDDYIPFLKLGALLFDILIVVGVAGILAAAGRPRRLSLLLLANPAFVYISLLWGQVDSVFTAFLVLALWAAVRQRPVWGMVCLTLSLAAKLQAIVLIPPLAALLLWPIRRQPRRLATAAAASLGTMLAVLAPFIVAGTVGRVVEVVRGAVGFHAVVSKGAYGFWWLVLPGADLGSLADSEGLWGVSYRSLGLGLLLVHYLLAGGALLWTWRGAAGVGRDRQQIARVSLALGTLVMAFFLFPTQMHERYLYPAVAFFGLYAMLSGRWSGYLLLSGAFLLNLEQILGATIFARAVRTLPPWLIAAPLLAIFWVAVWRLWSSGPSEPSLWEARVQRLGRRSWAVCGLALVGTAGLGMSAAARSGVHLTFTKPLIQEPYIELTTLPIRAQEFSFSPAKVNEAWVGGELRTGGVGFLFGFGVHATTVLTFDVPPEAAFFQTVVGLAESASNCPQADVLFRVTDQRGWVLAETGLLKAGSRPMALRMRLNGVTSLTLQALEGRNGRDCDHAVWGEPVFLLRSGDGL